MIPSGSWTPPFTFEERLKYALVPGHVYILYRALKEWRLGEPEVRLLRHLVDPERNSVDVGANKGVYTYFLARCSRHVYAFEPNPKLCSVLRRTAARNVTVIPAALADRSGEAVLRVPRGRGGYSNQGGSLSAVKVQHDYAEVRVRAERLDALDMRDLGFIKIDVEGFELQVLEGARGTLARDRPTLLIEMEEKHLKRPIEEAIAAVEAYGYRGLALRRGAVIDLAGFDAQRFHRAPATRTDYVYNFIFLPL